MSQKLAINGGTPVRDTSVKPWPSVGNASGRMLGEEELANLRQVIESGSLNRYGGAMMVKQFEEAFAERMGVRHACAVTSGTAALHTAVGALRLEVGDEIITTTVTDMGTMIAILMQNCIPVCVDVDRRTMLMDTANIEEAITDRTRAIIVVHLFGQPVPMDEVMQIADKYGLYVIEDSAQAHDAQWDDKKVGTIGHLGCFSLQQSKQITTGDGGIVITNDDELADHVRLFSDKYYDRTGANRGVMRLGVNYRMTELQGAVALAQVRKMDAIIGNRRRTAGMLRERLAAIEGIIPPYVHPRATHSWWIFSFQIDQQKLGCTTAEFARALSAEGLPFGTGYAGGIPICCYPALKEHKAYGSGNFPWEPPYGRDVQYREEDYPETMWAQANTLVMSWNEGLTEDDVEDLARGVQKVADYFGSRA